MYDQAVGEYVTTASVTGFPDADIQKQKDAYAKGGWKGYLQTTLTQMQARSKERYVPPFLIATIYARLGQKDEALAYLEKARQERDFRVTLVKVSFEFDSLRSDPRFADLVKRIGLPQ